MKSKKAGQVGLGGVLSFDNAIQGDVEMNPGPPKYPCGICSKNVNWHA